MEKDVNISFENPGYIKMLFQNNNLSKYDDAIQFKGVIESRNKN